MLLGSHLLKHSNSLFHSVTWDTMYTIVWYMEVWLVHVLVMFLLHILPCWVYDSFCLSVNSVDIMLTRQYFQNTTTSLHHEWISKDMWRLFATDVDWTVTVPETSSHLRNVNFFVCHCKNKFFWLGFSTHFRKRPGL